MLADELDYVLGVDTHRDEHVLAVVAATAGRRDLLAVAQRLGSSGPRSPRGGEFSGQFRVSLWIVGCPMLVLTVFSFSPSTRHGQGGWPRGDAHAATRRQGLVG